MKRVSSRKLRRAQSAPTFARQRQPRPLGVSLARYASAVAVAGVLMAGAGSAHAATLYWDSDGNPVGNTTSGTGLGGTGIWDTASSLWWDGVSTDGMWTNGSNTAVFTGAAGTVTLGSAITTGPIIFNTSGYTINGGGFVLTANGPISVNGIGSRETIAAQIAGTNGFVKQGGGVLFLTAPSNTYSGDTVINNGTVVITDQAQLGTSTNAVSINGSASTGNPGYPGGQLVFQGGLAGATFSRELTLLGRGPLAANATAALVSLGNNTFTGDITISGPASESRLISGYGTTTLTGGLLTIGTGQSSVLYGNGNFQINDLVTGFDTATDRLIKTGNTITTTLTLANANNNFLNTIRIDTGTVRVATNGALGLNTTNTSTQGAIDLNGGVLETRSDSTTDFAGRSFRVRANTNNTVFVGRAIGGSALNQASNFGYIEFDSNSTLNVTSIDGLGATFTGLNGLFQWNSGNPITINNNSTGLLTLNGSITRPTEATARTLTIAGNSDSALNGYILQQGTAGVGNILFSKSGQGTLTLTGTNNIAATSSTYNGGTNVSNGTLQVTAAIGNASGGLLNGVAGGALQIGNGGTFGAFDYRGPGETTAKTINLFGTTGAATILANETGTTPLVLTSAVGAGGAGAKTLYLGGNSPTGTINEIAGVINDDTSTNKTSLTKIGSGTWLYDPAAATYAVGATTTASAASSTNTNQFTVTSATGIAIGETVTGTNVPGGSVVTGVSGTTITISNNISTAIANATTLTFNPNANFTGNIVVASGTLQIKPTAASGSGSDVINNTSTLTFNVDPLTSNQTAGGTFEYVGLATGATENLGALAVTAGAGVVKVDAATSGTNSLVFSSLTTPSAGTGLNFLLPNGTSATVTGAANVNGIINGHAYFNGGDFASSAAGVVGAATYNTFAGGPTLPGGNTLPYDVTGDVTAQTTATINAGIRFGSTRALTLASAQTLTVQNGGTSVAGGLLVTGGSTATISGGTGITTGGTADLVVRTDSAGDSLILSTPVTGTTGGITKNGLGTLWLNAANSQTATTITVNEGKLELGAPTGASTTVSLGAANQKLVIRQAGTFELNGYNADGTSGSQPVDSLVGAGTVQNTTANTTSTLVIGNAGTSGVFSGTITDGGSVALGRLNITKTGAGVEAFTGVNPFTGVLTLTGGTLQVTNLANYGTASSIGKGAATNVGSLVFNGGALQYTGNTTTSNNIYQTTGTPSVSIDRLFTLAGNGTIDSSGTYGNSTAATRAANNAALIFSNTGEIGFSGAGSRTLTLQGDSIGDNQLNLRIVDNSNANESTALTKSGTGHWVLGNTTNVYSGLTTVSGGALEGTDGTSLSAFSNLVLNGGVFQTAGTFTRALGIGAGQVRLTGGTSGFAASTAPLVVTLDSGNQLAWGSTNFNPTSLILGSSSALFGTTLTNAIDLGSAARTIQTDTNANTSTAQVQATVANVISGTNAAATLSKSGSGNLILGDANTYVGNTILTNGSVTVTSIGSAGAAATSLGTNVGGGSILFNNGTNTTNILYVGPGETVTRPISSTAGNSTIQFDSSGTGALSISSFANAGTGTLTLGLRGSNTDINFMNATLTNGTGTGGGALTVTKSDGGVWVLNPSSANTFTGNINSNGGLLGLTAAGIGSAGAVTIQNAGVFAFGNDLTTSTPFTLTNNATATFAGSNNITLNGTFTKASGANDQTVTANFDNNSVLTINGTFIDAEGTANNTRTINWRGFSSIAYNGVVQNNQSVTTNIIRFDIRMADTSVFSLGGANTLTGGILLGQGTLSVTNPLGLGGAANQVLLDGGSFQSNIPNTDPVGNLTGANKVLSRVSLQGDQVTIVGTQSIDFNGIFDQQGGNRFLRNELTGGATLTLSGTINLTSDTTARTLTVRGASPVTISGVIGNGVTAGSGLAYSGLSTLTLSGKNTATGALTINRNTVTLSGSGVNGGTWNQGTVTLNPIGKLTLDNSAGNNFASGTTTDRLSDTLTFTGQGGTLNFISASNGSNETVGPLTLASVQTFITLTDNSSGAGNSITFASANFANSGSSLNLAGVPNLGTTNKIKITTFTGSGQTATLNNVLPRVFIGGGNLAAYDATNGVVPFTTYNATSTTDINAAAAVDTIDDNVGLTTTALTANRTINGIRLNGGGNVSGAGRTLAISSGAVLSTGADRTLDVSYLNFPTNTPFFQVDSGTTLFVNSTLTGGVNFAKALPGTLQLNTPSFISGMHNILRGTLKLNGGLNTLFPGQFININDSAVLDLNGNTQYVGQLSDPGVLPEAGGTLTSLSGTGTIVTNMASGSTTFATNINGNINLGRVGGNTLTLESVSTYNGSTSILGGTLQLQDDATIQNTSSILLSNATLTLNNNSSLQRAVYDRINDTTPITLRTGTFNFAGKVSDPSYEVLGALTAAEGGNTVTATTGGAGTAGAYASADVTFASLTRSAGATVNFTGTNLGAPGNNARIYFTSPLSTVLKGALGAWAIANTTDYAAYNSTNGIGVVGSGGFVGYDTTFASGNITNLAASIIAPIVTNLTAATTTTGLLRLGSNLPNDITFSNGANVLNLENGGILRSNNNFESSIGTTARRGVLTAGGNETGVARELIIYNAATGTPTFTANNLTLGSPIANIASTTGILPGMTLANANFPAGTTVVSVDNLNQITLSNASTATATGQTFTAGTYINGATLIANQSANVVTTNSTVGIAPGMTITGTGIPTGTYVVSVDSATQLTLSQPSTATGTGLTFTLGVSNMIVNSVIQDNGSGNTVTLVKSGAGILNLSANNLYTGGTVVNQGTLNLIGSGVVIPAGGLTITNGTVAMLTNNGQIASTNAVTLNGSSNLTLAGGLNLNNTLASLTFNNNGGTGTPTVTIPTSSILSLTATSPVTVTSANAATVPAITGGTLALGAGVNTFNVQGPTIASQLYTKIGAALNISSVITGTGSITKSNTGILQLSGQNTFPGGVNLTGGGVLISGNSTPTSGGAGGVGSGPLGTGALTVASGAEILVDGTRAIGNDVSFSGTPIFDSTANTVWTLNLNGMISGLTTPTPTINILNPNLTVALLGTIPNIGSITSFNKTGAGILTFNSTGYTGDFNATALGNQGSISLLNDGNGNGVPQTISTGNLVFDAAGVVPTVVVGRAGGTLAYNLAANKIIAPASVSNVGTGLTVTNNNGYGLQIGNATTFTSTPTITVATATLSNVTQGLYLNGVLSGTGFVKAGAGTVVLGNSGNTFGGAGNLIDITAGTVSVDNDSELGSLSNGVRLNANATTAVGLRATGTFPTSRVITLNQTTNAIEVTGTNTLTLNTAFGLGAVSNGLAKNDNGTLQINVANPTWTGVMTINQGAVLVTNAGALGTTAGNTVVSNSTGAALQLTNGLTVAEPLNIANSGIATGGALQSLGAVSGMPAFANSESGAITLGNNATIGADSNSVLSLTGGISGAFTLTLAGAGNINIGTTALGAVSTVTKIGSGISTLSVNSSAFVGALTVNAGTFKISGSGVSTGGTGLVTVQSGGTLVVDDSAGAASTHLAGRPITLTGGTFQYLPNGGNSAETFGVLTTARPGGTISVDLNGNTDTLTFASQSLSSDSSINYQGLVLGSSSNRIIYTTAPTTVPATTGILPRQTVNGTDFAAYNNTGSAANTNGVQAFAAYNATSGSNLNINSAGATDTIQVTSSMTTTSLTASKTINALAFSGNNLTIGGAAGTTLTLTAAGVLSTGGNNNLTVPIVATAAVQAFYAVNAGASLNVTSALTGTAGLVKFLDGTLTLSPQPNLAGIPNLSVTTLTGNVDINAGTLKLNGGNNTLTPNQFLILGPTATLDLNGTAQYTTGTRGDGAGVTGNAGTITNTNANPASIIWGVDSGTANLGATLTQASGAGPLGILKENNQIYNFYNQNTFTGPAVLSGNVISLVDSGTFSNTPSIDLNYTNFQLNNGGTVDNPNRINDSAVINLRGSQIQLLGRANADSSETLGTVNLLQSGSYLRADAGAVSTGQVVSAVLTISNLTQANRATVFFNSPSTLGQIGNTGRILVTNINGSATALTNNIIGAWAVDKGTNWASYIPAYGEGGLGSTGLPGYDTTAFPVTPTNIGTQNLLLAGTPAAVVAAGGTTTVNTINLNNVGLTFASDTTSVLNLAAGGILRQGTSATVPIGATLDSGRITAGGTASTGTSDLYLYNNQVAAPGLVVNSRIIDNPAGAKVRLVVWSGNGGVTSLVNGTVGTTGTDHIYTGGTVIQGPNTSVTLNGTAGTVVIPAAANPADGLIINGGTSTTSVSMFGASGQIAPSNIVTLNGNATLNLFGNNTLAGLVFTSPGGAAAPTVNTFSLNGPINSGSGLLTIGASGITVTPLNVAFPPTIGGRVDFGSSLNSITVNTYDFNGTTDFAPTTGGFILQGAVGSSGGITKSGAGLLLLGAQQIFTGDLNVTAGGVQLGTTNTGSRFSTLNLQSGTRLNLAGSSTTLGGLAGSGYVTNTGAAQTLTAGYNGASTTFSGTFLRFNDAVTNPINLVKIGAGNLTFNTSGSGSSTTGSLTVSRGGVIFKDAGTTSFPSSALVVNEGATLTLDNTGTGDVPNRLRGGAVTLNGGDFEFIGRSATASSETGGTLTLGPSASLINLTAGSGGGTNTVTFSSLSQSGNGTANVTGTALGTTNKLIFTTAPTLTPATTGILPRIAVNTVDFATYAAGTGVTAFTGYTIPADINAAAATDTPKITSATTVRTLTAARTLNAVNIIDNNVAIGTNGSLLQTQGATITSGGILVNGNGATISTPVLALGAEGIFRVNGDSLTVSSSITGSAGLSKTGTGLLTLSSLESYTGATALNIGNLTLAGGNNTLLVTPGASTPGVADLQVNGGLLDLNGNSQAVRTLLDSNTLAFIAGEITNSSNTPVTLTTAMNTNSTFGGKLSGNLGLTRSGNNTLTLVDAQTYTGPTIVRGGVLQLRDTGSIANSSSLTAAYSTITFDNSGLNPLANLNPTRIAATAPVTLQGSVVTLTGGGSIDSTLTLNSVTIADGQSTINVLPFVNEGSTALITIGNLQRNAANHSVVNFNGFTTNNSSGTSTTGGQGLSANGDIMLNQVNGVTGPVSYVLAATTTANSATVTVPSTTGLTVGMAVNGANIPVGATVASIVNGTTFTLNTGTGVVAGTSVATNVNSGLTNNLIGGWAVTDGSTFATYVTGAGVSVMAQTTQGNVAPGFTSTADFTGLTTLATGNYSDSTGATTRTLTASKALNSLRLVPSATNTITMSSGVSLTFGVGIIGNSTSTSTFTGTDNTSTITVATPGSDLYVYNNQGTIQIGAKITGNLNFVKAGGSPVTLNNPVAVGANDYTGGTFVQGGTLNLSAPAANQVLIPGDLTINNSTVTMNTNGGQIAATSNVIINGGGVLTLVGANTLNSVTFNSPGSSGTPTLTIGSTSLTLSSATPITAANDNYSVTPTVAGTLLTLQNGATITTSGLSPDNLIISAPIATTAATTPLVKAGTGSVVLSSTASTFANGVNLNGGSIIFGASSTPTSGTVTSGPIGTGPLNLADGVAILSDGTARTIANVVNVAGGFTFGTPVAASSRANAGNNLTLANTVTLAAGAHTITSNGLLMTGTISGKLTGGTNLTKDGAGTLVLSNTTNDFGGSTTVNAGILQLGAAGVIPDGSAVVINSAGSVNINAFNETVGSIAGSGLLSNSSGTAGTVTTGGDNTNTTFSGVIAGVLALSKTGTGTLILSGNNTYSGQTNVAGGTYPVLGGVLRITSNTALGGTTTGTSIAGDQDTSRLELAGNITVAEPITVSGRQNGTTSGNANTPGLSNFSDNNTITSQVIGTTGGGNVNIESQAGLLTLAGGFTHAGTGARNLNLSGAGNGLISGPVVNGTAVLSIAKSGTGTWTLSGTNTYTGTITANAGTFQFAKEVSLYNNTPASWTAANITANSGSTLAFNVGGTGEFTATDINTLKSLGTGTGGFRSGSVLGLDTTNAAGGNFTPTSAITDTNAGANSIGLTKLGANTLTLNSNSTYTGPTSVSAGTLEVASISGQLSGTTQVNVTSGGTILFSGSNGNRINDTAPVALSGGGLNYAGAVNGASEALGTLTLTGSSTLDFGSSTTSGSLAGNTLTFAQGLTINPGATLSITNWSGTTYSFSQLDNGTANTSPDTQDRLLFAGTGSGLSDSLLLQSISFYDGSGNYLGPGHQIAFGSGYEIVPVPEPSSTALLGGIGLLGLVGYRKRRKFSRK